MTKSQTRNQRR